MRLVFHERKSKEKRLLQRDRRIAIENRTRGDSPLKPGLGISFHSVTRWLFPLLLVSKDKDQRIFRRDNQVVPVTEYTQLARSSLTRHRFFVRSRAGRKYLIYEITRPRISFYCVPRFSLYEIRELLL